MGWEPDDPSSRPRHCPAGPASRARLHFAAGPKRGSHRSETTRTDGCTVTWWTFAGGRINQTLPSSSNSPRCARPSSGNHRIRADTSRARPRVSVEQVPACVARLAAGRDGRAILGRLRGNPGFRALAAEVGKPQFRTRVSSRWYRRAAAAHLPSRPRHDCGVARMKLDPVRVLRAKGKQGLVHHGTTIIHIGLGCFGTNLRCGQSSGESRSGDWRQRRKEHQQPRPSQQRWENT
jgi:hypothetical protein